MVMAARRPAALAALRAVATECQALAAGFSDEEAAEGLAITVGLRALFQRPASTSAAVAGLAAQPPELLTVVPPELLSSILSQLGIRDLACLAATCRLLWCDATIPPPLPTPGLVETDLRWRAEARGLHVGSTLPVGTLSWVPYLLKCDFHDALRREAPLAVGYSHSLFVDKGGRLHIACDRDQIKAGGAGEPLLGHDWGSDAGASTVSVPPTLVLSMHATRIVSVANGDVHCLALSAVGEVYSWGLGANGALDHADGSTTGPRRIQTLERVEIIAAATFKSAAVDDRGRLFTWGLAAWEEKPTGLGYELDPATKLQLTPKRVDALSEDRVVGVALASDFTLAVTDAGAVFSFGGESESGELGHGLSTSEVLPRQVEALAETGLRFVAVAAGSVHSLALTEEGHVYGWGYEIANGHGQGQRTPQLVTALAGVRVLLVYAQECSSSAVTETGELYTWGEGRFNNFYLGYGVTAPQLTPKRVEALSRVKVAAAAICGSHTLVAGDDGAVWGFGERAALGLGEPDAPPVDFVVQPTPIPNLRVRTVG